MRASQRKHPGDDSNSIQVTAKILSVLEYFGRESIALRPISFNEVSRALPLGKSTAHRIVYSLEKLGYLEKVCGGTGYQVGSRFLTLTKAPVQVQRLRAVAKDVMLDLLIRYSETICMGLIDEGEVAYLEIVQSPRILRIALHLKDRDPIHSTSLGKVILAHCPKREVDAILNKHFLVRKTRSTITMRDRLWQELQSIRENGVAFDRNENIENVISVAAPILDHRGRAIAGLSILGPTDRMEPKLFTIASDLQIAASRVSHLLVAPLLLANQLWLLKIS
jgi:DNA-binding IclR family transcriptional regulator